MAPKSEQALPGGSSHPYDSAAFAAYMFPGKEHAEFKQQRTQRLGAPQTFSPQPSMMHEAALDFHYNKEQVNPSRLRMAYNEHTQARRVAPMRPSCSTPELRNHEVERSPVGTSRSSALSATMGATMGRRESEPEMDPLMFASMSMNTKWYPHVSANRGALKLTRPAALTHSIDPGKEREHECKFFEAPRHRFAEVKSLPGGRPSTPTKSMKWRSDMAWNDPTNHSSLKVTHTIPKAMTTTSRSMMLRSTSSFSS